MALVNLPRENVEGNTTEAAAFTAGRPSTARASRKRILRLSSRYFPMTRPTEEITPPRQRSGTRWRSAYFTSSPDSCAGSAVSFDWGSAFTGRAVVAFRACPKFKSSGVRHICERLCYLRAYEVRGASFTQSSYQYYSSIISITLILSGGS